MKGGEGLMLCVVIETGNECLYEGSEGEITCSLLSYAPAYMYSLFVVPVLPTLA